MSQTQSPFRLLFVTQEDPFYVRLFFEEFLPTYSDRAEIIGVAIAPAMGKKSVSALARQMLAFYGPIDFVRMAGRYAWHKVANRLPWTGRPGSFHSIEQVCRHFGVPVIHARNVNAPEFLDQFRHPRVDLIVSVAAPQIFRNDILQLPRLGCINIHNAKLPKYRGMLPNFWQMFHGESTLGTSVHRINAALDDGAIVAQQDVAVVPGETLDDVICRTKRHGAKLLQQAIDDIRHGRAVDMPNDKAQATYYTFPTRQDVVEFRRRGYRLL